MNLHLSPRHMSECSRDLELELLISGQSLFQVLWFREILQNRQLWLDKFCHISECQTSSKHRTWGCRITFEWWSCWTPWSLPRTRNQVSVKYKSPWRLYQESKTSTDLWIWFEPDELPESSHLHLELQRCNCEETLHQTHTCPTAKNGSVPKT